MGLSPEQLANLNQIAVATCGFALVFTDLNLTIKGVPGFDLQILYKGEDSPYTVESAKPQFRITEADLGLLQGTASLVDLSVEGLEFSLSSASFTSIFSIDAVVPDLLGWIYLNCTLLDRGF